MVYTISEVCRKLAVPSNGAWYNRVRLAALMGHAGVVHRSGSRTFLTEGNIEELKKFLAAHYPNEKFKK